MLIWGAGLDFKFESVSKRWVKQVKLVTVCERACLRGMVQAMFKLGLFEVCGGEGAVVDGGVSEMSFMRVAG